MVGEKWRYNWDPKAHRCSDSQLNNSEITPAKSFNAGKFTRLHQVQSVALPLFWAQNPSVFLKQHSKQVVKCQRLAATWFLLIIFTYYKLILQFASRCKQTQNRTSILKAGHYHYPGVAAGWKSWEGYISEGSVKCCVSQKHVPWVSTKLPLLHLLISNVCTLKIPLLCGPHPHTINTPCLIHEWWYKTAE